MVVRIRLKFAPARTSGLFQRQTALALSSLLTPVALMAWALGIWRLAADLKWAGEFAIPQGLFSHWQVWFALGILLQFTAFLLHRFASRRESGGAAFSG